MLIHINLTRCVCVCACCDVTGRSDDAAGECCHVVSL